ncbi:solute carrier family 35 member F6-like [Amphiura filiformis]|uniref:solute carrier family 35 member F6-like n=1 Tax=Amphiura filiformis TaxID=82378 RepID=UPI003B216CA2
MALSLYQIFLACGMLITGSINTISKKAQNDFKVAGRPLPGVNGTNSTAEPHNFDHPWFQTVIMFIGEFLCIFGLLIYRRNEREAFRQQLQQTQIQADSSVPQTSTLKQPRIFQWIIAVPTVCDLFGTTLAGIGLLYVTASVWQMLRGSIIIFTGLLSKFFLKRKLRYYHWGGMILTMFGLVLVGISSIFDEERKGTSAGSGGQIILGIVLILAGQLVNGVQMIIEELFLKHRGFPPLQVVGMEGTFGFLILSFIVLPILYFIPDEAAYSGRYEDSIDALYQIKNSPKLLMFCLFYLTSIAFYNYFGLAVTKSLTAVHRTLIDACRTIVVWVVDLFIFYLIDESFGESFDITYGILQIDGFLFLIVGTALYNGLFDCSFLPCIPSEPPTSGTSPSQEDVHGQDGAQGGSGDAYDENERTPLLKDNKNVSI